MNLQTLTKNLAQLNVKLEQIDSNIQYIDKLTDMALSQQQELIGELQQFVGDVSYPSEDLQGSEQAVTDDLAELEDVPSEIDTRDKFLSLIPKFAESISSDGNPDRALDIHENGQEIALAKYDDAGLFIPNKAQQKPLSVSALQMWGEIADGIDEYLTLFNAPIKEDIESFLDELEEPEASLESLDELDALLEGIQ